MKRIADLEKDRSQNLGLEAGSLGISRISWVKTRNPRYLQGLNTPFSKGLTYPKPR